MQTSKPHKGTITNVEKHVVSEGPYKADDYGDNLGWIFLCDFIEHPEFGNSRSGQTSLAVSYDEETGRLETLNSVYDVI